MIKLKGTVNIETGFMVMKDGKAWGEVYSDGRSTEYGWADPLDGRISKTISKPSDFTYEGSHDTKELSTGKIVKVQKTTKVVIIK